MRQFWIKASRPLVIPFTVALSVSYAACTAPAPSTDAGTPSDTATPDGSAADTPPTGTPDAPSSASPIEVRGMGAGVIANGATYADTVLNGIPPYSSGVVSLSIVNTSTTPVMIESVTLEPVAPTEASEWAFTAPGNVARVPFTVMPQALAARTGTSVGLHFIPLAAGARDVRFTVRYGGGRTYAITVAGRGRDNNVFSPNVVNALERIFARSNEVGSNAIQPGAVVADAAGNAYFNVNANQWSDRFNLNVVLARVNADGRTGWVRELNEPYTQDAIDIGNNGEVGGNPDSLDIDSAGSLYTTFERSNESHNTVFQAAVMRVDAATGNVVWATGLNDSPDAVPALVRNGMTGHAVDASLSGRVLVAGSSYSVSSGVGALFVAALNKADGALLWRRNIVSGSMPPRVGALVVGADGTAYVGGIASGNPFVARLNGVNGAAPSLAWARSMTVFGSNVRGLAIEGDGLLAAINVRGASTRFVAARLSAADGAVVWAKNWGGGGADRDNTMAVTVHRGQAIFAGRIGVTPFDPTGGDGYLMSLNPMTGAWNWGSLYYTGRGQETIVSDYVTGVFSTSNGLWVMHQVVPGSGNMFHEWGRWYQAIDETLALPGGNGSMRLMNYPLASASVTAMTTLESPTTTVAHPFTPMPGVTWIDQAAVITCDDPVALEARRFRAGTQVLLQRVDVR